MPAPKFVVNKSSKKKKQAPKTLVKAKPAVTFKLYKVPVSKTFVRSKVDQACFAKSKYKDAKGIKSKTIKAHEIILYRSNFQTLSKFAHKSFNEFLNIIY